MSLPPLHHSFLLVKSSSISVSSLCLRLTVFFLPELPWHHSEALRKLYIVLVPQREFVEKILEQDKYCFSSPSKIFGEDNGASRWRWGEDSKDWALGKEAGVRAGWATWESRFCVFLFLCMWLERLVNSFWCLPMSLVQLQVENGTVTGQLTPVWF